MSHDLICSWLGLPPDSWPPDHYRLLGLDPGESDVALIEQRVHQRLDTVRLYQMAHPEQATEAMNRLAQAFVCLTEPTAKQNYDAQLIGTKPRPVPPPLPAGLPAASPNHAPPPGPPVVASPPPVPTVPSAVDDLPRDPLIWLYTPGVAGPGEMPLPPVRGATAPTPAVAVVESADPAPSAPSSPSPSPSPQAPAAVPVDPIRDAAQNAPQVRKGLATRTALYRRIALTRHLLRQWHKLGKYLLDPDRRLTRQEAGDLYRLIEQIEESADGFPLLGQTGYPGQLIFHLTALDRPRDLRNLDHLQRDSLRRDWEFGLRFLEAHRDFLRMEMAVFRSRSRSDRAVRLLRAWLNDSPWIGLLVLLALLAVGIAVWRSIL